MVQVRALPHESIFKMTSNFDSINKLTQLNAKGPDEDLEINLYAFGFAWIKIGSVYTFIYGVETDEYQRFKLFNCDQFDRREFDFFRRYRYVDWDKFFQNYNTDFQSWTRKPFGFRMYDVYRFFGAANTFFNKNRPHIKGFEINPL